LKKARNQTTNNNTQTKSRFVHQFFPVNSSEKKNKLKMIYAFKALIQLLLVVSVLSVITFPLQKKPDREFVAGLLARAAKGQK
jgi:hypothetical protein